MPLQKSQVGTVRITYYHHDQLQTQDQPRIPVYITSSLTVPPWQMLEMAYDATSSTESTSVYIIDFHNIAAGRYQYKFRIGYGCEDGENEEACWVLDEGTEVVEDDAGHKNSLLVVEETVDGLEVSGGQRHMVAGSNDVDSDYIENDTTKDYDESTDSTIENKFTRPRSGSLFSHEDLADATYPKVDPGIEDVDKKDLKDKLIPDININASTVGSGDGIFSPLGSSSPAFNVPSSFAVDKNNVHIASPRPRSTHRVIRRARSEILSRTTSNRPPLHQIIEEDSVSDFKIPRNSGASYQPLLPTTKAPTYEATDKSGQSSVAEHGSQENANGVRQRKVSGGTIDSHDGQSKNGERDGDSTSGSGHRNNPPTPGSATNLTPEEQQQNNRREENGDHSIWQWLLGCLRRRSTVSFILALAAISAVAITFITLRSIH